MIEKADLGTLFGRVEFPEGLDRGIAVAERRVLVLLVEQASNLGPVLPAQRGLDQQPLGGHATTVGITGAPGAGKSTLTSALVRLMRSDDENVGVLAVDPSSPFTGGAILGDRVKLVTLIKTELLAVKEAFGQPRRCQLTHDTGEMSIEDLLDDLQFERVRRDEISLRQSAYQLTVGLLLHFLHFRSG